MTNDEKWERHNGAHTLEDYLDFHAVNERFTGENDHPSTDAELQEAMQVENDNALLDHVKDLLVAAIRLQARKEWAQFAAAEAEQHNSGTREQGAARPSDSPLTACEWLRREGVL